MTNTTVRGVSEFEIPHSVANLRTYCTKKVGKLEYEQKKCADQRTENPNIKNQPIDNLFVKIILKFIRVKSFSIMEVNSFRNGWFKGPRLG